MSNSLTDRVFKKGFRVSFNPRGDGNCFFEAAAHQMRQDGQKLKEATFKWLQINRYDVSITAGYVFANWLFERDLKNLRAREISQSAKGWLAFQLLVHLTNLVLVRNFPCI